MAGHVKERRYISKRTGKVTKKWRARYPDPKGLGTRQIERTFDTRRAADDWLTTQRAAVLEGTHIAPRTADRPFAYIAKKWEESWPDRLKPATQDRYRRSSGAICFPSSRGVRAQK